MRTDNQIPTCGRFDAELKAYFDGELSLWNRFQVRVHLAQCPQCQEELKLMQTITDEVKSEEMSPLNSDLRDKILQNAPAALPDYAPIEEPFKKRSFRFPAEYALAIFLIGAVGVGTLSIMGNRIKNTFNSAANAISTGDDYAPIGGPVSVASSSAAESNSKEKLKMQAPAVAGSAMALRGMPIQPAPEPRRSVHKEGNLTVAVADAEATSTGVENLVKNLGGFVANNELSTGSGGIKTATLDIRVPVDQFENVVQKIGRMGVVKAKNISGEDVTLKVAVAGARSQTLSEQLSIAQAQLRVAGKKYKPDSNEIYQARAVVRNLSLLASQAKAEEQTLKRFAALSTLYITLQDKSRPVAPPSFSGTLSQTGSEAWTSFQTSARLPLQLLIWILAYSPLWVPALILWKRFGRRMVMGE